jgi:hypothetical protein
MKIIYILQATTTDYHWNGEDSIPVDKSYPAIAFESLVDAEQSQKSNDEFKYKQIYHVNCYEPREQV